MKRQKQYGMILLCTLVIMVIISIFLLVGVHRAQSSIMMTKRAIWEIKSYWAAKAGNTLAGDGCIRSVRWPEQSLITSAGNYNIRLTTDRNCVIGEDRSSGGSFNIYYINKLNGGAYASLHSNATNVEPTLKKNFDRVNVSLPNNEFYALSAGKAGAYVCGLELIYNIYSPPYLFQNETINQENIQAIQASSATACIYVANSIYASLGGTFTVDADGNTRPAMVVGGNITILGTEGEPSPYGDGPLNMNEGSVFASSVRLNHTDIAPSNTSNNLVNFGINVYNSFDVEGLTTPTYKESGATAPSGSFCLIEMPKYGHGNYQKEEYQSAVASIINTYLSPRDFWTIYGGSIAQAIDDANWNQEALQTNGDKIDNNANLKLYPCYVGCDSVFNDEYNRLKGYDSFESIISNQEVQDQIDYDNLGIIGKLLDKVDELTGNKITNADIAEFVEKLYRAYLRNAVNQFVKTYRPSDAKYEAFFVPDGNGITGTLYEKSLDVSYKDFTQARVLGVLGEYVGDISTMGAISGGAPSNLTEIIGAANYGADMNVFKYLGIPELSGCFAKGDEIDKIRRNYHHFLDNNRESYIADKVKLSDGNEMYLLDTIQQHTDEDIIKQFGSSSTRIAFDTNSLQFQLKADLSSAGYFNYGAFKRDGNRYTLEKKDNLGVLLKGHSLTVADDIDIKGYVYGGGSIKAKNIYFEASGTNMMNGEQDVSLISENNIRIKRNEGANGQGIRINGIIWAENGNISINPGSNEDVSIRGSLICKNGALTLTNVNNFSIVYDPNKARIIARNTSNTPWWEYLADSWNTNSESLSQAIETGGHNSGVVNVGTFKLFNRI